MLYAWIADFIAFIHLAFVGFVVLGLAAIIVGGLGQWNWIRNPWFRLTHLAAIVFVAVASAVGVPCPLTIWEQRLRALSGQPYDERSFIAQWIHRLLFVDLPAGVFVTAYILFGLAVAAALYWIPPWFGQTRPGQSRKRGRTG